MGSKKELLTKYLPCVLVVHEHQSLFPMVLGLPGKVKGDEGERKEIE